MDTRQLRQAQYQGRLELAMRTTIVPRGSDDIGALPGPGGGFRVATLYGVLT